METLYASVSVCITKFKKNPSKVIDEADGRPVVVLSRDKPIFYAVAPGLIEALLENMDDGTLLKLVRERLSTESDIVLVDIDNI